MDRLDTFFENHYSSAVIDFARERWHIDVNIPNTAGWYFISTNTPLDILQKQSLWSETYVTKIKKEIKPVKNYKIDVRSNRYSEDLSELWDIKRVYSGLASNLQKRAKEHTFPDPGTAALALGKYPDLTKFEWQFNFFTLSRYKQGCSCQEMVLALGEQVWRAKHGWPILCEE